MINDIDVASYIRDRRLQLNLTMDYVAAKAGITRATLSALENGSLQCSLKNLSRVLNVLDLELTISLISKEKIKRDRATRRTTLLEKKINRFIIMTIEEFAESIDSSSHDVYLKMEEKGIVENLRNDYEDLHGMSTEYLNQYIGALLEL